MDPQKLSQLDPKLREAYQRVMGTTIPQPQTPPSAQVQTPLPDEVSAKANPPASEPTTPVSDPAQTPQPTEPMPSPAEPNSTSTEPIPPPASQPEPFFKPQPVTNPSPQPVPNQEAAIPQQPAAQNSNFVQMNSEIPAAPAKSDLAPPASTSNFTAPAPQAQSIPVKKKNGMILPIVFGVVGLIFVAIYTLFWTKIFNFKLPFLP